MPSLKQCYKFTEEFGYIPEDWDIKELSELASNTSKSIVGGPFGSDLKTSDYIKEGVPVIQLQNIGDGTFINTEMVYVSENKANQLINSNIYAEEIILSKMGDPVARACIIPNKYKRCLMCSDGIRFVPDNKYSKQYLFYAINYKTFRLQAENASTGTTRKRISLNTLKTLKLLIPSLKEQEKISKVLGDIDSLIDNTQQLVNKKKDIKTATMQKLFKISNTTKTDILKNIANIQRGASPRPIDSPIWFDRNSNIGWTRISDIKGKYIYSTEQKLSQLGVQNSRYVPIGSLIMSICATLGRPAITKTELCIHDGFVCFYDIKVDPEYVYYYLQYIQENWKNSGQTGSQANLNTDLINNTLIPLLDNQKQIATILSDMDAEIEALEKELNKYKDLKTGMMQQLLTGKVRLI